MHLFSISSILLFRLIPSLTTASSLVARSDIDGPCTGDSGNPGVCVKNTKCTAAGGTYIDNACPNTPNDIKCCIKPSCGTGGKGNCRFTTSCSTGITETNKCPGPVGFKCCMPKGSGGDGGSDPPPSGGGGGRGNPDIPTTGSGCKQVAIDGAKKIVAQFPGKINPVYCIRQCSDPSSSDHCTGKATDLMVADGGVSSLNLCLFPCRYLRLGSQKLRLVSR